MLFKKNKEREVKKVAPHLPKEVRLRGGEAIDREKWFLQLFLLAVIFGFVSGVVGGMIVNSRFFDNWLWGEGGAWKSSVTISRTESKSLSRDNLNRKALSVVFDVFPTIALNKDGLLDTNSKLGSGFFLTSNGYAATSANFLNRYNKKDLIAINSENKIFRFGQVFVDSVSDLAIVKMEGESGGNLPFSNEEDIFPDLEVWLPLVNAGILPTNVLATDFWSPKTRVDYYFNSEKVYRQGLVKNIFDKKDIGAPLVNLRGEVVGMLLGVSDPSNNFSVFLKSSAIATALKQVLNNESIQRAYLGLHFQEANNFIGATDDKRPKYGVILSGNPITGASFMDKKSPLVGFDLKDGDALLSINEELISPLRSLPEILLDYAPGDKVKIKYERKGAEKNLEINLGKI